MPFPLVLSLVSRASKDFIWSLSRILIRFNSANSLMILFALGFTISILKDSMTQIYNPKVIFSDLMLIVLVLLHTHYGVIPDAMTGFNRYLKKYF